MCLCMYECARSVLDYWWHAWTARLLSTMVVGHAATGTFAFASASAAARIYLRFSIFSWSIELDGVVPLLCLSPSQYHSTYTVCRDHVDFIPCYYVKVQFRKFKLQDKMTHTVKIILKKLCTHSCSRTHTHTHTMMAQKPSGKGDGRSVGER